MINICIEIFFARIFDVSLNTIRTFFTLKGKTIFSTIISFFEILIWFIVARKAINVNIDSIWIPISYALGYSTGNLIGGPGYSIKGEFTQNGYRNNLSHTKGVISMARSSDPDSAGSQFFIVLSDEAAPSLDGMYAGFGKVIEGMDVIEKIENTEFEIDNEVYGTLKKPLTIEKAIVDTKGYTYKVTKK